MSSAAKDVEEKVPDAEEDASQEEVVTANGTDAAAEGANAEGGDAEGGAKKKKKRKKRKKKKKGGAATENGGGNPQANGAGGDAPALEFPPRGFNMVPAKRLRKHGQTLPPTKTVSSLYPKRDFPEAEIMPHPLESNTYRITSEEKRAMERLDLERIQDLREAAEIHRLVRHDIQRVVQPGMSMVEICERIEETNRRLIGLDPENPMSRSIGFPTGCSLNNVAAHYTPNTGDKTVLSYDDVMKIDFGTQINGNIIDCAFTVTFNPKFDEFIGIVKEATNTGLREMGIDVRLSDIGAAIQEVMEAGEVELDGRSYQVKSIRNLNGHSIDPWRIHAGKSVPAATKRINGQLKSIRNLNGHSIGPWRIHAGKSVPIINNGDQTKMEEGELFAIETFGSTGNGNVIEGDPQCSHYMRNLHVDRAPLRSKRAKQLLHHINHHHGSLAFCRRWLDGAGQDRHIMGLKELCDADLVTPYPSLVEKRAGQDRHIMGLKELCDADLVTPYPSLVEKRGSITAQYEHTVLLRPTCKEVLSRGFDY